MVSLDLREGCNEQGQKEGPFEDNGKGQKGNRYAKAARKECSPGCCPHSPSEKVCKLNDSAFINNQS